MTGCIDLPRLAEVLADPFFDPFRKEGKRAGSVKIIALIDRMMEDGRDFASQERLSDQRRVYIEKYGEPELMELAEAHAESAEIWPTDSSRQLIAKQAFCRTLGMEYSS